MPEQDPLAQLRDIHLPDAVSAWPPAPGWWLIAGIVLTLITVTLCYIYRRYKNNQYRRLACKALNRLHTLSNDQKTYLQQLNTLLKQTALAASTDADVASLTGKQWLQFLDQSGNTTDFSEGIGNALLDGPYNPEPVAMDMTALHRLSERWIKRHRISC